MSKREKLKALLKKLGEQSKQPSIRKRILYKVLQPLEFFGLSLVTYALEPNMKLSSVPALADLPLWLFVLMLSGMFWIGLGTAILVREAWIGARPQ